MPRGRPKLFESPEHTKLWIKHKKSKQVKERNQGRELLCHHELYYQILSEFKEQIIETQKDSLVVR